MEEPPWSEKRTQLLETIVSSGKERRATLEGYAQINRDAENKMDQLVIRLLEQEDKHQAECREMQGEIKELQQQHMEELKRHSEEINKLRQWHIVEMKELQLQHKEELQRQQDIVNKLQEYLLKMACTYKENK